MKKLLSAVCLLSLASTLAFAQEFYRTPQNEYSRPGEYSRGPFDGRYGPRGFPQQRHYVCSVEFKPVCGRTRQNIMVTYSNQCFAEQDGAHIVDPTDACPPIACPATYEPVCGRRSLRADGPPDGERRGRRGPNRPPPGAVSGGPFELIPYYNECAAKQDGAVPLTNYSERRFRHVEHRYFYSDVVDFNSVCPKTCSGRIELVCGEDEAGKLRLYANRCSAILEGALFIKRGVCSGR
jgi:hypothetical protein